MKHKKWVIYFVLANGFVKIGTTSDYDRRIKALKAANASFIEELGVIEGGNDLEKSIHQRFRHCHSHVSERLHHFDAYQSEPPYREERCN